MKAQIKAIEIILGMFILLVVAVALLQVFRQFMTQQSGQLEQTIIQERVESSRQIAMQKCNSLCNEAVTESCSEAKVAEYCLQVVGIDYNGNGETRSNEFGSTAGIYSCEEPVYCFQTSSCEQCGIQQGAAGARKCKEKLCSYWRAQGLSGETLNNMAKNSLKPGDCISSSELVNKTDMHWFMLAFGNQTVSCT